MFYHSSTRIFPNTSQRRKPITCKPESRQFGKCGLLTPNILTSKMKCHFCIAKEMIFQHTVCNKNEQDIDQTA